MNAIRHYSFFDQICLHIDQAVRALTDNPKTTDQPYPAKKVKEGKFNEPERKQAAALMRVNHAGEICAQALYQGQALVSRDPSTQTRLQQAALEEGDHLSWCKKRLDELGDHTSYLKPFWYFGSLCIGMAAGCIGDEWSLGFIVETERQVIQHLERHQGLLPDADQRSLHILKQMTQDEAKHRDEAMSSGAKELPGMVKKAMSMTSKMMVKMAYWV